MLMFVLLIVGADFQGTLSAASNGPYSPTIASDTTISGSNGTWSSPSNALASDGVYASVSLGKGAYSDFLTVSGFGFTIPSNATINGIQANIEKYASNSNISDYEVEAYNPVTSSYSANLATTTSWPSTDSYVTYGGSTNLWGTNWTPAAIDNSNFSVNISAINNSTPNKTYSAYVDYISITVSYSQPLFSESSYEWYQNTNSVSSALTPLASQNTVAQAPVPGTPFRLRTLVNVAGANDPLDGQAFDLQYAFNGSSSACSTSFTGVTYANVTSTTPISFYSNSSLTDGQNITALSSDPTDGSNTIVPEQYMQSNTYFNNIQSSIPSGEDGEWDIALNDTSATPGYYCFRIVTNSGGLLSTYSYIPTLQIVDQPPTAPTSLTQSTTQNLSNGSWTNSSPINFSAKASSGNYTDTLKLCIEVEPISTPFTNVNTSCGSGVAYSGTAVTISDSYSALTSGIQYHWQARTEDAAGNYSAWVQFGTSPNFGYDTSPPTGGSVFDGSATGVEEIFNNGSLSQLSANWSGFSDTTDGIVSYSYSIGTTAGSTNILGWTSTTGTAITATGLSLHTGQTYYFNVEAYDAAGNVSNGVSSSGQMVAPTLSFSITPSALTFANLGPNNPIPWTDSETTTISASSNAYNGFIIRAYLAQPLSNKSYTINAFNGGTYATPNTWTSGDTGFGYTSSDTSIGGSNIFQSNPCPGGSAYVAPGCFAPYSTTAPGDIIANQASGVVGSPASDTFTITNRVTVTPVQSATTYSGVIVYSLTPNY
jgi:hypothetical protein